MLNQNELKKLGIKVKQKEENPLLSTLKRHYPHILQDGKISLKSLKESLAKALNLQDANELENMQNLGGYELNFTGKGLANALYNSECEKELKLDEIFELNALNCHDFAPSLQGEAEISSTQSIDKDSKAEFSSIQRVQDFGDKNGALQGEAEIAKSQSGSILDEKSGLRRSERGNKTNVSIDEASDKLHDLSPKDNAFKVNNMIIKGDNLDALKILKSAYSGKIKIIYIDPPYNTGSDNFIYPDNFRDDYKAILREVGLIEINENGQEVESENLKFFKNITASRTHSGWLCFMLPRLKLARDLLKDDGVIFISIDDNEQANLKLLCDEIFGEDNFVSCLIWHSKNKPSGNTTENKTIDTRTEYILCFAKNNFLANKYENTKEELQEKGYVLKDEYFEERGYYKLTPLMHSCSASSFNYIESLDYEIQAPDGTMFKNHQNIKKPKSYSYTWGKKLFDFGNANGFIEFQKTSEGFWCAYRKMYEYCAIDNKKLEIIYRKSGNAYNNLITGIYSDIGANEIRNLMNGEKIFTYAKPVNLIKHLLKISTNANVANKQPDIILDFFAGSGTTAQAVMELNSEDKGNREFILVQTPEPIDEKKSKTAFDFAKFELKSERPAISDITIERVKRAAKKIYEKMKINDEKDSKAEVSLGDFVGCEAGSKGVCLSQMTEADSQNSRKSVKETTPNFNFKVFSLKDKAKIITSDKNSLKIEDKSDLSPFDKALNLILQSGNSLNKNIKTIIENKLYECENAYFVAHLDKEVGDFLQDKTNEIYLNGFEIDDLEGFLNLSSSLKENITVIF